MTVHIALHKYFIFLILYSIYKVQVVLAEDYLPQNLSITFCTTSAEEQNKCKTLSSAVQRDMGYRVKCKQRPNKDDCMRMLDQDAADITTLDAGEVFMGGRYQSLVPILQETYGSGETHHFAVAVIKRGTLKNVRSLLDLRGKKACFAGVGTLAGWILPIYILMKFGNMTIDDCNNHVKSAIQFFGPSCAVNSLINKYNPLGENSDKLCRLCGGSGAGQKCTPSDPYYDYEGAVKCLNEEGEIAFLKHSTIMEVLEKPLGIVTGNTRLNSDYELLCLDASRRPVTDYRNCNWGRVPTHAVVTSSAKSAEQRRLYQRFIKKLLQSYSDFSDSARLSNYNDAYGDSNFDPFNSGDNNNYGAYERFQLFESAPRYGSRRNLLFQDDSTGFRALEESKQTYTDYLGDSMDIILGVHECPVKNMTLCVTSEAEMEKCIKMRIAMRAQLLKPEMFCYKGHSQINCMQAIKNGVADVAVFDAGDIYTAGLEYELVPFMSETYNLDTPEYYVVAVTKEEDPDTEITYLKGKYTCHTGVNMAAGWIMPLAFLISNGWIRSYGCNSIKAAAEYFTKSCVPGALSAEYNTGVPYDNMCDLCHGSSYRYCRRDASEDYFGYTGAFRCLVEGGGNVAFVKHTTVMENADGKRKEYWARNTFKDEFQLLCPDGTRGKINDFEKCALGKVKANAIVTRGGLQYNITEIDAFVNLFRYTQQFYGSKDKDDFSFSMFSSPTPYSDLIFQDATTQLLPLAKNEHHYPDYLGEDFLRAKRIVDCFASAHTTRSTLLIILFSVFLTLL